MHYAKLARNHNTLLQKYEKLKAQNNGEENENKSTQRPKITAPDLVKIEDAEGMDIEENVEEKVIIFVVNFFNLY